MLAGLAPLALHPQGPTQAPMPPPIVQRICHRVAQQRIPRQAAVRIALAAAEPDAVQLPIDLRARAAGAIRRVSCARTARLSSHAPQCWPVECLLTYRLPECTHHG